MAKMCPYCTPVDEELGNSTHKEILVMPLTFNKKYVDYFSVQIFLGWSSKKAKLVSGVFNTQIERKINYCPICGRDLNKYIKELEEGH